MKIIGEKGIFRAYPHYNHGQKLKNELDCLVIRYEVSSNRWFYRGDIYSESNIRNLRREPLERLMNFLEDLEDYDLY